MNIALVMTAVKHGAVVANHVEVTQLRKNEDGKLVGAQVRDALTGEKWDVKAKVCMAAGFTTKRTNS
jgi:glycerol-3-phosphate dehydrogenase